MTWHSQTRCYFGEMADDDDNETGMTPEERHRWRVRRAHRGLPVRPLSMKHLKTQERRKKRLRRKRNGSVQRRRVSKHDGRLWWIKALKAAGRWIPVERYCEQNGWEIKHWRRKKRKAAKPKVIPPQVSQSRPPPPPPTVSPGKLVLKPRVADPRMTAVRQSFSKGRSMVVIEKRGDDLSEPLPQPLNAVPADKV